MAKDFNLKDNEYEAQLISSRVYVIGVFVTLLMMLIIIRIFYLTIFQYDHYTTLAKSNRVKVAPIQPTRGLIYSHDGVVLAENKPSFSLEIIPEQTNDLEQTIIELQKFLTIEQDDINSFKKALKKQRRFERLPLRFNLDEEEVASFSVNRHRFPGVDVVAGLNRYYPFADELVHTLGYVARIDEDDMSKIDQSNYAGTTHIGKLGIEKSYESILHGEVGYQHVEVNAQGRIIRILERKAPIPGDNLHLTIDVSLQKVAEEELGDRRGSIVAMDTRNGDVLAFVSSPGYDPNKFVNGIDSKSYKALLTSKDKPLINRAIQGKYPPGSTIKPLMGLIGLNYGVTNFTKEEWCPGWYSLNGHEHRYRCWKRHGHGYLNLHDAIAQSCDVYFYLLAFSLGIDHIYEGLSAFGFGKKTGIDIGGEAGGLLPSREWKRSAIGQPWYPGETLIIAIGQGYTLSTPLQLAKATAIVANHGKVVVPRLVSSISNVITNEVHKLPIKTEEPVRVKNPEYWDEIIQSMRDVVHGQGGTAWSSGLNASYEFAGKTGTAQVISIAQDEEYKEDEIAEEHQDHALFIAFAPVDKPEIAIAIVVENGGGGSKTAAPIARTILDNYMLKRQLIGNNNERTNSLPTSAY